MADYRVNLEVFAGPLDLLLYLVRKEEVDIYDIPLARITEQYVRYIEMLKSLDIDLAGDFLVMAATLMEIKSAMLLPKAEPEQFGTDDLTDPRSELIRQLLEYKKFKDAANLLNAASDLQSRRYGRPDNILERLKGGDAERQIDLEQVSLWDLLEAFDSVMKSIGPITDISHIKDDTPIDLYQIEILHRLQTEGPMSFERIFESKPSRAVMVGLFLALLELVRERLVWAEQARPLGSIYLKPLTDEPAAQAVQKAILTSASEAGGEQPAQKAPSQKPAIEIEEMRGPATSKPVVSIDSLQAGQSSAPITELAAKRRHSSSPQVPEEEQTEDVEEKR